MIVRAALALMMSLAAPPLLAQALGDAAPEARVGEVRALHDAMRLPEIVDIMAEEGEGYGADLAEGLFGAGPVPASWSEGVAAVYDRDRIAAEVLAAIEDALAGRDVAAMLDFFQSDVGRRIAELEVVGRRAMLDDDVEQAAKEAAAVAMADDDPRLDLIKRYAEANDLIETNVAGALNSNFAYFAGLMDGGATGGDLTEADVLKDVWAQEPRVRADTTEWIYSFLLMAYSPASDEDLEALIAFSKTGPGQDLNSALFAAFDGIFTDVSRALGLASARFMTTQTL